MLTWTENYGNYSAKIGRIGNATVVKSVDRNNPGYKVSAFGVSLKERAQDIDQGKEQAIDLARRLLAHATAAIAD